MSDDRNYNGKAERVRRIHDQPVKHWLNRYDEPEKRIEHSERKLLNP